MSAEPVSATGYDANAPQQEGIIQEPGFKVFAGNLAYATTDEGLKQFFAPVADDIISTHIILRGPRSAGYGFVTVTTEAAVEKAVAELNRKELDGRAVIVEAAKPAEDKERSERRPKKRFGRRGSKAPLGEVTEAEADGEATEKPTDVPAEGGEATEKPKKKKNKPRNKRKKTKPAAATANTDGELAATTTATENQGATIVTTDGETPVARKTERPRRFRRPRQPRPPRVEGEGPPGEPSKSVVFVANLSYDVDDAGLAKIFTDEGINVVSARVVMKRFGHPRRSKGYGFVDVGNEENQTKAVELFSGRKINDREIAVKIAVNNTVEPTENVAEDAAASQELAIDSA